MKRENVMQKRSIIIKLVERVVQITSIFGIFHRAIIPYRYILRKNKLLTLNVRHFCSGITSLRILQKRSPKPDMERIYVKIFVPIHSFIYQRRGIHHSSIEDIISRHNMRLKSNQSGILISLS